MPDSNKRPIPNGDILFRRERIFKEARLLVPLPPESDCSVPDGLEQGNKKTGLSGQKFDWVFVWNLPLRVTCPGASDWCNEHCYNSDNRKDVYPMEKWQRNWWWAINEPSLLQAKIIQQLESKKDKRIGVRFHSCGDFYSVEYIKMWHEICSAFSQVRFWGYSRSWAVPDLLCHINELANLENVNLFASWDSSMTEAPIGWNRSIVASTNDEVKQYQLVGNAYICPEQYKQIDCCADCALCTQRKGGSVVFILH